MTGTNANNKLGQLLQRRLREAGVKVKTARYDVLLSYPVWSVLTQYLWSVDMVSQ